MNVLLIGSGGREHALAWALRRAPSVDQVICAPGNGGMAEIGPCVPVDTHDVAAVDALCATHKAGLVVIGPEDPLVAGLADGLRARGRAVVGPSASAARLEGSKAFMKALCTEFDIPTAAYERIDAAARARDYAETCDLPVVVKADGLAAGKGVIICSTRAEVIAAVADMTGGRFGAAGNTIVFEEFMEGEEASFFALTDGKAVLPLIGAQDHKRVGDGDVGPNTGGMGAYSPAPVLDAGMTETVMERIIEPTVRGMAAWDAPFEGTLYAGLMIGKHGPRLIEYNVRFGDPECQVLMPRLEGDLGDVFAKLAAARLEEASVAWRKEVALTVVMATQGYPGAYDKGSRIAGLEALKGRDDLVVFHAGTRVEDGAVLANGGRVLNVTALAPSVREARAKAYDAIGQIDWPDGFCRKDIGWRALEREERHASVS